jgi:hypothetical protein
MAQGHDNVWGIIRRGILEPPRIARRDHQRATKLPVPVVLICIVMAKKSPGIWALAQIK